jgi:hypothetical protein
MTGRRRGILAVLAAALTLALAACAGLPTSGPVFAGIPPGTAAVPDFSFVAQKPQPGATPEQIVQGFIGAGIGPENNWAVAQLYLAPSFRGQWKPGDTTTIDDRSSRAYLATADDKVQLTITQRATVDKTGAYKTSDGGRTPLGFSLAKVEGEWRITAAPDGIVIGADQFTSVYRQYPLMFFDPDWRYLVPDVRWFPSINAATHIVTALINGGPSPWLAGSVVSAFPDAVKALPSVPSTGGVAQVALTGPVLSLEPQPLGRMQTQLQRSLANANIADVSMSSGGAPVDAQGAATASTRIDGRALVRTKKGFGFLAGDDAVEPITGLSTAIGRLDPVAVVVAADYSAAAVRTSAGVVARVPAAGDILALDQRPGLVDPVIDAKGEIWSVPRDDPKGLVVFTADGKRRSVTPAWSNASRVTAMAISRDGTRMAAILTVGGQPQVAVFGIVRSTDGAAQLGDPLAVAKLPGEGIHLTWLGDTTLGVLAHSGAGIVEIEQIVGGPGVSMAAPDGVTAIAGTTNGTVRLRGADGTLYSQRGSNWEQAGSGILVLAGAQGMPAQG